MCKYVIYLFERSVVFCFACRALFDYDPLLDVGLPGRGLDFKYGDILNVVGDADADWWHTMRVMPDDGTSGIVPSRKRLAKQFITSSAAD